MKTDQLLEKYNLELYVKDIFILENTDPAKKSRLPFFADGYPGIIFLDAPQGALLFPVKKKLSTFFLYGLTIEPIEIAIKGTYKFLNIRNLS